MTNEIAVSPAAPCSPIEDDDLLWEILLRLSPLPSSLPRASAVCKRWRRLVTDPRFLRSFRDHHRKEGPPILGFFVNDYEHLVFHFHPILDPPNSVPLRIDIDFRHSTVVGCRHGRILIMNDHSWELVVVALITGEQQRVPIPTDFDRGCFAGSVMCTAGDDLGHVHGACHSSHYKAVLVSAYGKDDQTIACVYSSETGAWSNLISTAPSYQSFYSGRPGLLAGNTLCWLSTGDTITELDLEEHSLSVVRVPPGTEELEDRELILAEDAALGFVVLSYPHLRTWQRNVNSSGVALWMPWKTIEMHTIIGVPPQIESARSCMEYILCYDEDTDTIFMSVDAIVYMVQLRSMKSKRLLYRTDDVLGFHPFKSFYPPGTSITGDGAEILHDK